MKSILLPIALILTCQLQAQKLIHKVNPFIGTGGHGHTYPGATGPFGMVQLSPDTRLDGWDGCGGYHYDDSICYGFSHTHLSGTGVSDYGDLLVRPGLEPLKFSHSNEKAHAGYYAVTFSNGVFAEVTAGPRTGMHHYRFPAGQQAVIVLDLEHRDYVTDGHFDALNTTAGGQKFMHAYGHRFSKAWADDQQFYFDLWFSSAADTVITLKKKGEQQRSVAIYFPAGTTDVYIRADVSFSGWLRSSGQAKTANAQGFAALKKQTEAAWEKQLGKITVKGNPDQEAIFYTALYHTMIVPNLVSDPDGSYRGMDKQKHEGTGDHYSVFSLWDTYRATHPLYTLIEQKRTRDFMKTFLRMYRQSGRLPVWELASNETNCMIGYHAVSVIADAMAKGIMPDSAGALLEAAVRTAESKVFGLDDYMKYGFLSIENESESVSKTLEYAYDDWCIAKMAEMLNDTVIAQKFYARSKAWMNLLDPETKNMRPRENGRWLSPFEPKEVNNHYTEANSWHYSFSVQHDLDNWISGVGGSKVAGALLDTLFTTNSKTSGREQADITGLIGQYAHGNEPSHHIAYLYNSIGKPEKTQQLVRKILIEMYHNSPDGLSGNEDCGQMSAWYVLSSLGFYPVCPGDAKYSIGYPLFRDAVISFENNKSLKILRKGKGEFIRKVTLNGKPVELNYLNHNELIQGGKLEFTMGENPSLWGTGSMASYSTNVGLPYSPAPVFVYNNAAFTDSLSISVTALGKLSYINTIEVKYRTDFEEINDLVGYNDTTTKINSVIRHSACLTAQSGVRNNQMAAAGKSAACFYKRPNNWNVTVLNPLNKQYTAGGAEALTDGIKGDDEWRKGHWQGIQGRPYEAVIDLGDTQQVRSIHTGFLQDTRSWIVFPRNVSYSFSLDGENWSNATGTINQYPIDSLQSIRKTFSTYFKPVNARYIKIRAAQYGVLPEWHAGAGGETFIFVDELEINKP